MTHLIKLQDVSYKYDTKTEIISKADFTLNKGEMVYVRGESGSGKSTFLRLLNRLLEPTGGSMEFCGERYGDIDPTHLRKKIQLVSQTSYLFSASVAENLQMASSNNDRSRLEGLMEVFRLSPLLLEKSGRHLSVGQAARICVIRSLLLTPDVMLLDEPTAALDPETKEAFHGAYDEIRKEMEIATVWVTHDPGLTEHKEGRHVTLSEGKLHG